VLLLAVVIEVDKVGRFVRLSQSGMPSMEVLDIWYA
jgi:hypothetical protein